jgi:Putative CRISPR-associated protein (Cas_VVA1548)
MSQRVIISRHEAAIQFIKSSLPDYLQDEQIPIISDRDATEEDVRGKVVYGNLPMHLASKAFAVVVVEFTGSPPRGREYTLQDMHNAGAVLKSYKVTAL